MRRYLGDSRASWGCGKLGQTVTCRQISGSGNGVARMCAGTESVAIVAPKRRPLGVDLCGGLLGHDHPFSRRVFRVRVFADDKLLSDAAIGASGGSCFVLEPPLIDSLPARMIPKSGLPVFGRDHAQEKEAERRQTQGCACPHASGVRDAPRRKAACAALRLRARSPAGVPPRLSPAGLSSPGLSIGPGFPRRNVKLRRAATRHLGHSDAPRAPVVVPAGMMPEPPGCGVYLSVRGRRTRSAFGEYPPRRRPLRARLAAVIAIAAVKSNGAEFSSTNRAFRATRLFCKGAALQ